MTDLQLLQPQRLTDYSDGGGLATANPVVDGAINNVFDDITRLDRVNGAFSLRKVFAVSTTADASLFAGAHVIIQAPPADPRVSSVLFETGVWGDERSDAESLVESYLDQSVITRMIPYDLQLAGQRSVLAFQQPEIGLPPIGGVFALSVDSTGEIEFFRIQNVTSSLQTFTDGNGDYQLNIITLTTSYPLSQQFVGSQPNRYLLTATDAAVLRGTIANSSAVYKGVTPLAADASIGDLSITVDSVFAQLVPSTIVEVPVAGARPGGVTTPIAAATATYTVTSSYASTYYTPTPMVPGTISITRDGGGFTYVDDGAGNIINPSSGNAVMGSVNYTQGLVTPALAGGAWTANSLFLTYLPAGAYTGASLSTQVVIDISNRGYVFVIALNPPPAPGTATLSYLALGTWVELTDNAQGALRGAELGDGVGAINYETGTVTVTLGALPDIGSSIITTWGTPAALEILTSNVAILPPATVFTLIAGNCDPGTLTITWLAGVTTKTATDTGNGTFSGDATGTIIYATGEVLIRPTLLANVSAVFSCSYHAGGTITQTFFPSLSDGVILLDVSPNEIAAGSIKIKYQSTLPLQGGPFTAARTMTDNGSGALLDEAGAVIADSTVNYVTGQISWPPNFGAYGPLTSLSQFDQPLPSNSPGLAGYYAIVDLPGLWPVNNTNALEDMIYLDSTSIILTYKNASTSNVATTEGHTPSALTVDLTPLTTDAIIPSSLMFSFGGHVYYERAGALYFDMNPATGSGTPAGSIDYTTGVVTITNRGGNVAPVFTLTACLGQIGQLPLSSVQGRTPGLPLQVGTFFIQANRYSDGVLITAVADSNGNISTADMHGVVDVTTGVYNVAFGAYELASSLTSDQLAAPWYNSGNIDGTGNIWVPAPAIPGSVTYNCVVTTSLPLNLDLIGVNPVRLPVNGQVQTIRPGDTLVVHDELVDTMPNPLSAGQVVAIGRAGTMSVALYDANGLGIPSNLYAFDAGTNDVTFASPLNLTGYVQPLVAINSIEDMVLVTDVQITGELTLGTALTHAYTADHSLASGALIIAGNGNAQARYSNLFAQETWLSVWSDTQSGGAPSTGANYNDATYPIAVLNRDCITEEWALIFTDTTDFNIVGNGVGVVGTGNTGTIVAPNNPATGYPYFEMAAAGFGSGWSIGNVIRFDTFGAGGPLWVARTVVSGPPTDLTDLIRLQLRWDAN
jgi:hypothetical protein